MIPPNVEDLITVATKLQQLGIVGILMLCVIVLIVVIYHKDKKNEQKHIEMLEQMEQKHSELIELFLAQSKEEKKHHQDTIDAWRRDREAHTTERRDNFSTLIKISSDSATALHGVSTALREFSADINRIKNHSLK